MRESDEANGVKRIAGEVRAFDEEDLRSTLDSILSVMTSTAALSEAVLEARWFRSARPRVVPRAALESLARGLWKAGLRVRFGACWTPLYAREEAAVGIRGMEDARERIEGIGPWEVAPSTL